METGKIAEIIGNLKARASAYEAGDFCDMSPDLDREAADALASLTRERDEAVALIRDAMATMAPDGLTLDVRQATILKMALLIGRTNTVEPDLSRVDGTESKTS